MHEWTAADETEFRRALAVRKEVDARFSGYFFDQSLVYVLLTPTDDEIRFVSNLIHELGHAELADSPLGFLHQLLFEILARCAEWLYGRAILPVLKKQAHPPDDSQLAELDRLAQGGSRDEAARHRVRAQAKALFYSAQVELTNELAKAEHAAVLSLYRRVLERRQILIDASHLCHEAAATFGQLAPHPATMEKHKAIFAKLTGKFAGPEFNSACERHLAEVRHSLRGQWLQGFEIGERIFAHTGNLRAVSLAARLAHHVPCTTLPLLTSDLKEFQSIAATNALHVDHRMQALSNDPGTLIRLSRSAGSPLRIGPFQQALQETIPPAHRCKPIGDFAAWINEKVFGDPLVTATGLYADIAERLRKYPAVSPYETMHVTTFVPPPILLTDGRVLGGPRHADILLKRDFVRAEKVRIVERILERTTQ